VSRKLNPTIRALGRADYEPVWRAMQAFTKARDDSTPDELWFVEHPPVFTLGLAAKPEHVLDAASIPVVRIDRGGQVTYHGPGQLVAYVLLDLRRAGFGVKELVRRLEQSVIDLLAGYRLEGARQAGMPGVYVGGAKIAAVGLRVSRGCSFHGIALNVDADLAAFSRINPCGYPGLAATRLADLGVRDTIDAVQQRWQSCLVAALYDH
jgi:lipoyl(octanoyl) transferase